MQPLPGHAHLNVSATVSLQELSSPRQQRTVNNAMVNVNAPNTLPQHEPIANARRRRAHSLMGRPGEWVSRRRGRASNSHRTLACSMPNPTLTSYHLGWQSATRQPLAALSRARTSISTIKHHRIATPSSAKPLFHALILPLSRHSVTLKALDYREVEQASKCRSSTSKQQKTATQTDQNTTKHAQIKAQQRTRPRPPSPSPGARTDRRRGAVHFVLRESGVFGGDRYKGSDTGSTHRFRALKWQLLKQVRISNATVPLRPQRAERSQ